MSPPVYDYLLYYECASKDYVPSARNKKIDIIKSSPGTLINHIDWSVTGTTVPGDAGGNTKCGITHGTWKGFWDAAGKRYGLTCGPNVDKMDKNGWLSFIDWYSSGAADAANDACKLMLFQNKWGSGYGGKLDSLLEKLKSGSNNPSYPFKTKGTIYEKLADATHAFSNPMDAFQIIRNHRMEFLWSITTPDKSNKKFRNGWLRRTIGSFQDDGLYIAEANELYNIPYEATLAERVEICNKLKGKGNYVKICDWGSMPSAPSDFTDLNMQGGSYGEDTSSGSYGSGSGSGDEPYRPKFSSSKRDDPHLSAHKETELKPGMLLGPEYNVK